MPGVPPKVSQSVIPCTTMHVKRLALPCAVCPTTGRHTGEPCTACAVYSARHRRRDGAAVQGVIYCRFRPRVVSSTVVRSFLWTGSPFLHPPGEKGCTCQGRLNRLPQHVCLRRLCHYSSGTSGIRLMTRPAPVAHGVMVRRYGRPAARCGVRCVALCRRDKTAPVRDTGRRAR